jgi:hypothetical protein
MLGELVADKRLLTFRVQCPPAGDDQRGIADAAEDVPLVVIGAGCAVAVVCGHLISEIWLSVFRAYSFLRPRRILANGIAAARPLRRLR